MNSELHLSKSQMDNLLKTSNDKTDYVLKQYESNVETMRREKLSEIENIKNN